MMRIFCSFLFVALFAGCTLFKNKTTFEGGGSYMMPGDKTSTKEIQIIKLIHSIGVIFPAGYGKKIFGVNGLLKNCNFFTPDSILIRKAELEINRQYCAATDAYWKGVLSGPKVDTLKQPLYLKDTTVALKVSAKFCLNWRTNQIFYDRQYIGYVTSTGDKIIIAQLIDFRNDPRKYKEVFSCVWISGWHGWFYSNTSRVYFNVNKNKLTIEQPN